MGRYYYGDIEGKFWFGVQSSGAADQFGYCGKVRKGYNTVCYNFTRYHLKKIEQGISVLESELGDKRSDLEAFFDTHDYYNDQEVARELKVSESEAKRLIRLYADYLLGIKIKNSVLVRGQCMFEGDL